MSSGFNTDVRVGEQVFHVQTEDRGPAHPRIDTAVYQNGRVLHRRSSNYAEFAASAQFAEESLRRLVEQQHRAVIEELRSGALKVEPPAEPPSPPCAIQVQLLNPKSWLSAGNVVLDVEIVRRTDGQPQPGVLVEAEIQGALKEARHAATTDEQGRVHIRFPLPPLGKGDLALVIHAMANGAWDEIRFEMRTRNKPPASPAVDPAPGS